MDNNDNLIRPEDLEAKGFVARLLSKPLSKVERPRYVGRAASAATATGLMSKHMAQLQAYLDETFAA